MDKANTSSTATHFSDYDEVGDDQLEVSVALFLINENKRAVLIKKCARSGYCGILRGIF